MITKLTNKQKARFPEFADGYVNATAMCSAVGKQFFDYHRLKSTEEFMAELASDTGIPVSRLVISRKGNTNSYEQGTRTERP